MWILLEIILALLGRKFGRADEQEDLEDVKNSEEYMVMTPLQQWKARRRSKVCNHCAIVLKTTLTSEL